MIDPKMNEWVFEQNPIQSLQVRHAFTKFPDKLRDFDAGKYMHDLNHIKIRINEPHRLRWENESDEDDEEV